MGCSRCGSSGVIFQEYSGLDLCKQHFREDLIHKAKRTVRQNRWLVPGMRYAVALSGGPVSCALLDFMHALVGKRNDISLIAFTIKNSHPEAMKNARAITDASGIHWFTIPKDSEDIVIQEGNGLVETNQSPFLAHASIEYRLALMAEQLEIDTLAMGYTLEDHAQWVLWNAISGNTPNKPGYDTGRRRRVRIIRPFMHIPGQELDLYTRLFLDDYYDTAQAERETPVDDPIGTVLARFYSRHPGVPYALVNIGEQVKKFQGPWTL